VELMPPVSAQDGQLWVARLMADGRQRSYFLCANADLSQVSADHV
jgi:hypothetical protein